MSDRERTLHALSVLRERAETRAQTQLTLAQREARRAERVVEEARAQLSAVRATTRGRGFAPGDEADQTAFALQQAQRFRAGQALREAASRRALRAAQGAAARAAQAVTEARRLLEQSHAERRVVEARRERAD